jgi:starch phosphorylase
VIPQFSTRRMLNDYTEGLYHPAARQSMLLAEHGFAGARRLAEWKERVRQAWPKVSVALLSEPATETPRAGRFALRVAATLAGLEPRDVRVEFLAHRRLPAASFEPPPLSSYRGGVPEGLWRATLAATGETTHDGAAVFTLDAEPPGSGQFATEIRIHPHHELLSHPYEMGLMKWV